MEQKHVKCPCCGKDMLFYGGLNASLYCGTYHYTALAGLKNRNSGDQVYAYLVSSTGGCILDVILNTDANWVMYGTMSAEINADMFLDDIDIELYFADFVETCGWTYEVDRIIK